MLVFLRKMKWKVCLCVGVVFTGVFGFPRSKRVNLTLNNLNLNDSDRTPSSPELTSSHLDIREYTYSEIFRTLPPTNSSEEIKKKRKKKHKKKHAKGLWTKAGSVVSTLLNGYNIVRNSFGNSQNRRKASRNREDSDDDEDSEDYSYSFQTTPTKRLKRLKSVEASTMSLVEQAYRRSLTFTPRYKWDDTTTIRPNPPSTAEEESEESENPVDKRRKDNNLSTRKKEQNEKLASRKEKTLKSKTIRNGEIENFNSRRKGGSKNFQNKVNRESEEVNLRRRGRTKEFVPRRRRRRKEILPWQSKSYVKPILRTTSKVIRGLDTLAQYGSYFSYTLLPMSVAAIQTVRSLLPAPETIAKLESSPPLSLS